MEIISNLNSTHGSVFSELLSDSISELILASPFLAKDFQSLFENDDFSSVRSITLITTLKKNDQDQITKPRSLKSFYQLVNAECPKAKVKVHINNSLHGKIYIFKKCDNLKALVTSANLTQSGFYNNHEWGLLIDDSKIIKQLENELLECIEYAEITESLVDRLVLFSDQYQKNNPDWGKDVTPSSDILDDVYYQGQNNKTESRYYLKPFGTTEDPTLKEDQHDFSDLHPLCVNLRPYTPCLG